MNGSQKLKETSTMKFPVSWVVTLLVLGVLPIAIVFMQGLYKLLDNTPLLPFNEDKFSARAEIAGTYKEMHRLIEEKQQRQDFLNQIIIYKANCDGTEFMAEKYEGIKIEHEKSLVVINQSNETIEYPTLKCTIYKKAYRDHFGENLENYKK